MHNKSKVKKALIMSAGVPIALAKMGQTMRFLRGFLELTYRAPLISNFIGSRFYPH